MERVARLFRNGRNQAVRLPVEFEFDAEQVYVFKEENGDITLSTKSKTEQSWQQLFALLPEIQTDDFLTSQDRQQPSETRDPFEGF